MGPGLGATTGVWSLSGGRFPKVLPVNPSKRGRSVCHYPLCYTVSLPDDVVEKPMGDYSPRDIADRFPLID